MTLQEQAEKIVDEIINDLNDRSGLGIDMIDEDIQAEIRNIWIDTVIAGLKASHK